MGDRANLKIASEWDDGVHLYTHWSGSELPKTLKAGLIRGVSRWDDPPYLARILFCEMVRGHEADTTGFGISCGVGDGDDRVLTVDCSAQTVTWPNGESMSFTEYTSLDSLSWESPHNGVSSHD